jgi:hypothetical protein
MTSIFQILLKCESLMYIMYKPNHDPSRMFLTNIAVNSAFRENIDNPVNPARSHLGLIHYIH